MSAIRRALRQLIDFCKKVLLYLGVCVAVCCLLLAGAWYKGYDLTVLWPLSPPAAPSPAPTASSSASGEPTPSPTPSVPTLRVGVDGRCTSLPFWAVPDCLRNEPTRVKLELVQVPDAELRWQMLAANRLDLACGTLDSFALGAARGYASTLLLRTGTSKGADVLLARKGINDLHGLTGKRVALAQGHPGFYLMVHLLDQSNMSRSDVELITVDRASDTALLLREGAVDAAWVSSPDGLELKSSDAYTALASTTAQYTPTEICAASPATLQSSKPAVQAVLRAWFRAVDRVQNTPGLAKDLIARNSHLSPAVVGTMLGQARFFTAEENHRQSFDSGTVGREMARLIEDLGFAGMAPNAGALDASSLERTIMLEWVYEVDGPASGALTEPGAGGGASAGAGPRGPGAPLSPPRAAPAASAR